MDRFVYYITVFFVRLFGLLPFWAVYKLSDFLSFLLFHVVKYRRSVVYKNLKLCFPEKSEKEIYQIARKNYTNLSDQIVEAIKGFTLKFDDISKRYRIMNAEILNPYLEENRSVFVLLNHFGNWEWATFASQLGFRHKIIAFYKPLSNRFIDAYLRKSRESMDMKLASYHTVQQTLDDTKGKMFMYILIADQNPSNVQKSIWVDFFNVRTACLHGPEKYALQTGFPIFFADVQHVGRGFYELTGKLLFADATNTLPGDVTHAYMQELEAMIRKNPENWLWTHKRWKHNKIYVQK